MTSPVPARRSLTLTLGLLSAVVLSTGCPKAPQGARIADRPRPAEPDLVLTADFKSLFELPLHSRPVFSTPKESSLMERLLLSPNLVFESSRSSLEEPATIGPKGATPRSPNLSDALGEPIDIRLSTILLNYLAEKKSRFLAPVVSRRWSWEWWCTPAWCPKTTWVERLVLMHQKAPGQSDKPVMMAPKDQLPTAAFAVRRLGLASRSIHVGAQLDSSGKVLNFVPVSDPKASSICGPMKFVVPVVSFMAEIVSLNDGRILARIDEERIPKSSLAPRREFVASGWEPVKSTAFTGSFIGGSYEYVSDWRRTDLRCAEALKVYDQVRREFLDELQARLPDAVAEIFRTTLDPLY